MASKLEKHEEFILGELAKGKTYTSIAATLASRGCETSTQNLIVWAKRRAARIQARQALVEPAGAGLAGGQPAAARPKVSKPASQVIAQSATIPTSTAAVARWSA